MLPFLLYTCVGVTKFKSLNSLLTAEAIEYVNFNKANIMTGEEIYKMFSYGPQVVWIVLNELNWFFLLAPDTLFVTRSGRGSNSLPSSLVQNKYYL